MPHSRLGCKGAGKVVLPWNYGWRRRAPGDHGAWAGAASSTTIADPRSAARTCREIMRWRAFRRRSFAVGRAGAVELYLVGRNELQRRWQLDAIGRRAAGRTRAVGRVRRGGITDGQRHLGCDYAQFL